MSNSIAPGSSADVNVKVTALTTNPNVPAQYKTIILKKNLVSGVNTLTQEMMSSTNTKYVIKYDYTLGEDITVPSGCVLEFDGGSISNASGNSYTCVLQNTFLDGNVCFDNVVFSGTCANQVAYQSWFKNNDIDGFIDFINAVGGCANYSFSTGVYNPTKYINKLIEPNGTINIIGNGCKLHYNEINVTTPYFYIAPTETVSEIIELTTAVNKGDGGIAVPDVSKFQRGDYIILKDEAVSSFNYCRNYSQGEIIKVERVKTYDSRIVPDHFIYGNYTHMNEAYDENEELVEGHFVKILKVNFINVNIKNLDIRLIPDLNVADYYTRGVDIYNSFVNIDNFNCYNFRYGTKLDNCLNSSVRDCKIQNTREVGDTGDTYGLQIVDCQNVLVQGCTLYGGRHAITISAHYGGLVSRFITVDSCYCIGYRSSAGINCHGPVEFVNVVNCTADGISIGCNEYKVINCNVSGTITSFDAITFNGVIQSNNVGGDIQIKTRYFTGDYVRCLQNYTPNTDKELLTISNNNVQGEIYVYTSYNGTYNDRLYTNLDNTIVCIDGNSCTNIRTQLIPGASGMSYPGSITWINKSARVVIRNNRYNFYGRSGSTYNICCKEFVVIGNKITNYDDNPSRCYSLHTITTIIKDNILESEGGTSNNGFFGVGECDNIYVENNINTSNRPIINASIKNRTSQGKIFAKHNVGILSYISMSSSTQTDFAFDVISIGNYGNRFDGCNVTYQGLFNGEQNLHSNTANSTLIGNVYKEEGGAIIKFTEDESLFIPKAIVSSYASSIASGSDKTFKIKYQGTDSHKTFGVLVREMRTDGTAERTSALYIYDNSGYAVVLNKTWPRGTYYGNFSIYHDTTNNTMYLKISESLGTYNCNIELSIINRNSHLSRFEIEIGTTTETMTTITSYGNGVAVPLDSIPASGLNRRSTGEIIMVGGKLISFDGSVYHDADGATSGVKRSGATTGRPVGSKIYVGFMFMDTTLGKPIFASTISGDTVTWVDATGATV